MRYNRGIKRDTAISVELVDTRYSDTYDMAIHVSHRMYDCITARPLQVVQLVAKYAFPRNVTDNGILSACMVDFKEANP